MKKMNLNVGQIIALILALLMLTYGQQPAFAQQQSPEPQQQTAQQQRGPGFQAMVDGKFIVLGPTPDEKTRFTVGQIMVAARQLAETGFYDRFVQQFGSAKTRTEQEDAVQSNAPPALLEKFRAMNQPAGALAQPEDYEPVTDPEVALNMATVKQRFKAFSDWGDSPFGRPATDWKDLCQTYQNTMTAMVDRTSFPEEMKVEWMDELGNTCVAGLDGRYKKVVDLVNWPLWQWTTGRTAAGVDPNDPDRIRGVNVMYTGGSALALYIFLPKSQVVVLHPFNCRGNPTVPFIIGTFKVTKQEVLPPRCVKLNRLDGGSNVLRAGESARFGVQIENPSNVDFSFRYVLRNVATGAERVLGEDRPEVNWVQQEPGSFRLAVTGEYQGKPIDAAACVADLTFEAPPAPPVPPTPIKPVPPPAPKCEGCPVEGKTFRASKEGIRLNPSDFVKGRRLVPGSVRWYVNGNLVSTEDSLFIPGADLKKYKEMKIRFEAKDVDGCEIVCHAFLKPKGGKWWILVLVGAAAAAGIVAAGMGKKQHAPPAPQKTGGPGQPNQ